MKLKKIYLHFSVILSFNSSALEGSFETTPKWIFSLIARELTSKDLVSLSFSSKRMNGKVEKYTHELLDYLLKNPFETRALYAAFTENKFRKCAEKKFKECMDENGYVVVPQGAFCEGDLARVYHRVSFHTYLERNGKEWASSLFSALFGKEMPEEHFGLALNSLTACLPVNHIYVKKNSLVERAQEHLSFSWRYFFSSSVDQEVSSEKTIEKFKQDHGEAFIKALHRIRKERNYFLFGLEQDYTLLRQKPHFIVVNESQYAIFCRQEEKIFKEGPAHSLIFNLEKSVVKLKVKGGDWKSVRHLIIANGKSTCKEIENFSFVCPSLKTVDTWGMTSVEKIGFLFLYECIVLESIDTFGLTSVKDIEHGFLMNAKVLKNFDATGLTALKYIGDFFLSHTAIQTLDLKNSRFLEGIGMHFLQECEELKFLELGSFGSIQHIGTEFLCDSGLKDQADKIREEIEKRRKK